MITRKSMYWSADDPAQAPVDNPNAAQSNNPSMTNPPSAIETVENRIYFYSEIQEDRVLQLNKAIRDLGNSLLWRAQVTDTRPAPIFLNINSYGGGVFAGLSSMDEITTSKVPVITVVDGICASAATFLSVSGHHRCIKRSSFMLIHQVRSGFWGTYESFNDQKQNLDTLMTIIKDIYKQHTKIPMKKLNEILKHDIYFGAKQAKEYGLVDEII